MSLGPIKHDDEDLPYCNNLENYFQYNKVYEKEVDSNGKIKKEFYEMRIKGYKDDKPHRRKYTKQDKCLYSLWKDKKYNYIESRYFYCHYYEMLAKKEDDYKHLVKLINKGYNIMICGYDAYEMNENNVKESYLSVDKPFGHERVLYTMLRGVKYPWL